MYPDCPLSACHCDAHQHTWHAPCHLAHIFPCPSSKSGNCHAAHIRSIDHNCDPLQQTWPNGHRAAACVSVPGDDARARSTRAMHGWCVLLPAIGAQLLLSCQQLGTQFVLGRSPEDRTGSLDLMRCDGELDCISSVSKYFCTSTHAHCLCRCEAWYSSKCSFTSC